ncbi:hypothetical protein [Spirosoma sp.]|uniref:hypothetical protein n=1 Tax=Spirosoma sp. TaxID=1899569 RepID=UPI0026086DD4|nr:hypothetical protein [Spirosoma sp.]MCX6214479.1 hypothetical protein [Spirosoma sp.]
MKTTTNAFALLFAAISFTACTHESIEPVRPTTPVQPVFQMDSIQEVHILPEKTEQAESPFYYGLENVGQKNGPIPSEQPHVIMPSPRQAVMPVVKSDTLAQY